MKKKLIFITEALWVGGIEAALVNLLNRLDYDKYEVTCLIIRDERTIANRINSKCRLLTADRERVVSFSEPYRYARLFHLTQPASHLSRLHRLMQWTIPVLKWMENLLYIRYIRKQMKAEQFDTAVIYSDRTAEIAVRAIRADKYLMYYHHGAMRHSYHDEIGYKKSEKIIAVSDKIAEDLRSFRPQYRDKIVMINNLVDASDVRRRSQDVPKTTFPTDAFNLVTCGRISPEKGMDLAAEACAVLLRKGLRDLHWWIVGGGPAEPVLRAQLQHLKLEDHFHLLGMQSNPYPYLRMADIYVQPSRFEGHSVTILEARVLAKPIVATHAAAREQLTNGLDGLLCESTPEAIAAAILSLYDDAALRACFSASLAQLNFEETNHVELCKLEKMF